MSAAALCFCLLFSGCVLYPKDEDSQNENSGGFPQELSTVLLSNGVPSFDAPSEIVGLNLNPSYSDYSGSDNTFVLSYTGANQKKVDDYASYLAGILGTYYDATGEAGYSCYGWFIGGVGIELGFSTERIQGSGTVSVIPSSTLYLLIITDWSGWLL
jgi:hypothetical protein